MAEQAAVAILDSEIQGLEVGIKDCEQQISEFQFQIDLAKSEIASLKSKIAMLIPIREKIAAGASAETESAHVNGTGRFFGAAPKLRPSKAILKLLKRGGEMESRAILDSLENQIESKAKDKRQLLSQTLGYLVENKKISKKGEKYKIIP